MYQYVTFILLFLLPITFGAVFLKQEIIIIAFGRGLFDSIAVEKTVDVFMYSAFGIVFFAEREILSRFFYSAGDTKTPLINSGFSVTINIILNLILSRFIGASGLALASTISSVIVCILLLMNIRKTEIYFRLDELLINTFYICLAGMIMLLGLKILNDIKSFNNVYIKLMMNVVFGSIVYFGILWIASRRMIKSMFKLLVLYKQK